MKYVLKEKDLAGLYPHRTLVWSPPRIPEEGWPPRRHSTCENVHF